MAPGRTKTVRASLTFSGCPLETLLKPSGGGRRRPSSRKQSLAAGPFFDTHRTRNVTAFRGVTTYLVCRVRGLGNNTVRSFTNFFNLDILPPPARARAGRGRAHVTTKFWIYCLSDLWPCAPSCHLGSINSVYVTRISGIPWPWSNVDGFKV